MRNTKTKLDLWVSEIERIEEILPILEICDSLFGVEVEVSKNNFYLFLLVPPYLKKSEHIVERQIQTDTEEFSLFEYYLSQPFFLPLHKPRRGLFEKIEKVQSELLKNEKVVFQFFFQPQEGWQHKALELYDSYLHGNGYPSTNRMVRKVQEKSLKLFEKLGSFDHTRKHYEEIEEKILESGYQVQIRILGNVKQKRYLQGLLEGILKPYEGMNGWKVTELKVKHPDIEFSNYEILPENKWQILSESEVKSLFGFTQKANALSTNIQPMSDDLVSYLPTIPKEEIKEDTGLIERLANAIKSVRLIQKAMLYDVDVVYGYRLIKVTCRIPKDKNFSDLKKKSEDIQVALGVKSLSIIQGEEAGTVSFLLPNNRPQIVSLREMLEHPQFEKCKNKELSFPVGMDVMNNPIYLSLAELRHLLVTGTNGSGKSVFVNQIILTLLMRHTPQELMMYLIDPKKVEFTSFHGFPQVQDVVTDMEEAVKIIESLTVEMDKRFDEMEKYKVRNIQSYNEKVEEKMPYIVVAIDEYADMVMQKGDIEDDIIRLGQKARAAGIHMIIATQRPSADILSSNLQANLPNAISFNLGNNTNYRTVFGTGIPYNNLLGKGDGVMKIEGWGKEFERFQSPIISLSDKEIDQTCERIAKTFGHIEVNGIEIIEEVKPIDLLKTLIAETGETRVREIQSELNISMSKVSELMNQLVEEGWLMKHKARNKGYELIADEDILDQYRKGD